MKINFIDLKRQYKKYKKDIDAQIQEVLDDSSYIMGSKVKELEALLADYVGVKYAIGCASGTDALMLALMALGVQAGDEIITTPFTFIATAEVISLLGARPVFVDIKEDTFNIDPAQIESKITVKTRGIIAVDLFGQCADYDAIYEIANKRALFVIEDAAQSFGAEYKKKRAGSLADVGCVSFFPAKPLGCYGDGGMVFTSNKIVADVLTSLRVHGQGDNKYDNVRIGINARLDTLQAAALLAKFKHFPEEIGLRQKVAQRYVKALKNIAVTPIILKHNVSAFAQYCIRVANRAQLQEKLKKKGVPTGVYYPKPLHLQAAFQDLGYRKGDFPMSEKVSLDILALPMHPYLTSEEQDYIINCIKQ
ncbi:DegT/DnrJ/EryC1/StrS family aminotransferase [Candidatus Omnitrophota bacterium]